MAELKADYKQEHFITLSFEQMVYSDIFHSVDTLAGTVQAGWQGRFRLEMPHQQLISNGILYWSYSVENEQVLVDSVADIGGWNPLTLLYDPEGVYQCAGESCSDGECVFTMQALDSETVPSQFTLTADSKSHNPLKIEYIDDNDSRVVIRISDFERLGSIDESTFEFVAPDGVEVIEMP
ncbi:MAG: outer membrane lipoprotein carrier protein LolA [Candidatus Zixiibacteriota bacterium]